MYIKYENQATVYFRFWYTANFIGCACVNLRQAMLRRAVKLPLAEPSIATSYGLQFIPLLTPTKRRSEPRPSLYEESFSSECSDDSVSSSINMPQFGSPAESPAESIEKDTTNQPHDQNHLHSN